MRLTEKIYLLEIKSNHLLKQIHLLLLVKKLIARVRMRTKIIKRKTVKILRRKMKRKRRRMTRKMIRKRKRKMMMIRKKKKILIQKKRKRMMKSLRLQKRPLTAKKKENAHRKTDQA